MPRDLVERERLTSALDKGAHLPLTLVAAPAGYGKSTLVSHWLGQQTRRHAWLSLDEADNDVRAFLGYFVAAVRSVFPEACQTVAQLLDADELPSPSVLAKHLANDLDAIEDRLVLALDDYHRVREPAIHELLDHLLEHPPRSLLLVIVSRRNPGLSLASLRVRGLLNEIRLAELAFTSEETSTFLEAAIGRPIENPTAARLHERTEGWPVGLRLASSALQQRVDEDAFLREFGGDSVLIQEYLMEQLLSRQSSAVRDWLTKSSILARFCAPLCEAVCASDAATASDALDGEAFVRAVQSTGLLSIALDARGVWFRHHHLLQELLQQHLKRMLEPDAIAELHRRAARWLEEHDFLEEAQKHLLKTGDADEAGRVIVRHRLDLVNQEQWSRLDALLRMLPTGTLEHNAELLLARALSCNSRGRFTAAASLVARIEALLSSAERDRVGANVDTLRGELDVLRAFECMRAGKPDPAPARRALERLPVEHVSARGHATILLFVSLQMTGRQDEAHAASCEALELSSDGTSYHGRILTGMCFVRWMVGDLKALERTGAATLKVGTENQLPETVTFARYFRGLAQYHLNDLRAAEQSIVPVVSAPQVPRMFSYLGSRFLLSLVRQAQARPDDARELIDSTIQPALEAGNTSVVQQARAFDAALAVRQGRLPDAIAWAEDYEAGTTALGYGLFVPELVAARVFLSQGTTGSLAKAGELLATFRKFFQSTHNTRFLIETDALQSLLHDAKGEDEPALEALDRAVSLAHHGGFIRLFLDLGPELGRLLNRLELDEERLPYVGRILAAYNDSAEPSKPSARAAHPQPLIDPLSKRELEVLSLLAEQLSNREIGGQLYISPSTVKRHAENIFDKLGVRGRREAVAKASGLGILGA